MVCTSGGSQVLPFVLMLDTVWRCSEAYEGKKPHAGYTPIR
jgi:hypothetical protein